MKTDENKKLRVLFKVRYAFKTFERNVPPENICVEKK
jgi:hypothetical protein